MPPEILVIDEWSTPASQYPLKKVGTARISRFTYNPGFYRMEGIDGYMFFQVTMPIQITNLKIGRKVHMVDDPLHWYAMREYVQNASPGHLLCAGLGLGLMVWWALEREDITRLTVVEINPDVIALVSPLLPKDDRLEIVCADYYEYRPDSEPDCILWDLAVGKPVFFRVL